MPTFALLGFQMEKEFRRVPGRIKPRRNTSRNIVIRFTQKNTEINYQKQQGNMTIYKGTPTRLSADFNRHSTSRQKGMAQHIKSDERVKPTIRNILPSKTLIQT